VSERSISQLLGAFSLALIAVVLVLGLGVTGVDVVQGEVVRILYIHPAVSWVAYMAFGITSFASLAWLRPKSRKLFWDQLAGSSAEIGVVFTFLALLTGAIWGRSTWGVWWTWDARTTSTLLLLFLYLGVLALRQVPQDRDTRARRSAVAALLAFVNVPIVHFSVDWWRTLHQEASLATADKHVHGLQSVTMLLGFLAFTLVYFWLLMLRYRVARWEDSVNDAGLDDAIAIRRAEAARSSSVGASA
jgi:heme exporter protein C